MRYLTVSISTWLRKWCCWVSNAFNSKTRHTDISLWRSRKTSCRKLQSMPQLTTTISKSYLKKYDVNTIKRSWFTGGLKKHTVFYLSQRSIFSHHICSPGLTRLFLNCTSMYTSMLMRHPQLFWCLQRTENMCFLAKKEAKHQPIENLVPFVSDSSFLILLGLQMRNFKGNWNESQSIWNLELHT